MDQAENRLIPWKIRPPPIEWEPFKARAPSRTVIAHYALNCQMRSKAHTALTAPLVLHHTRIYKRAMKKIIFKGQRWTKCAVNILRSYLNWWHNWQVKNRRRSHTLKGSHLMGDGRIFLKTRRDTSFNKDLSNEPNFDRIHLAGWTWVKV